MHRSRLRKISSDLLRTETMKLTEQDFERAAAALQCEVNAVKAVAKVESNGAGHFPDGRPVILFEAHYFSRLTSHEFDKSHPQISAPKWDKTLYKGGAKEWDRLDEAAQLDRDAALRS